MYEQMSRTKPTLIDRDSTSSSHQTQPKKSAAVAIGEKKSVLASMNIKIFAALTEYDSASAIKSETGNKDWPAQSVAVTQVKKKCIIGAKISKSMLLLPTRICKEQLAVHLPDERCGALEANVAPVKTKSIIAAKNIKVYAALTDKDMQGTIPAKQTATGFNCPPGERYGALEAKKSIVVPSNKKIVGSLNSVDKSVCPQPLCSNKSPSSNDSYQSWHKKKK
ncbi:hypothetical protein BJ742DRAFT_272594 [Cladochytrium replicatum]|nr:hypothetical protein BJ742DRAFT_272594 [Cladochytrium replicatum]